MKHIHVTCAIIEQHGFILAAQRSATMSLPLKWEFPGGKIDPGETAEECLQRELLEELELHVCLAKRLPNSTHHYPDFVIARSPSCTRQSCFGYWPG